MSKRILALALFAVMVLSLVPMAQAAPETSNVVYEILAVNQSGPRTDGFTPRTNVGGGTISGNQIKSSSFSSDWNVLTINAAFKDLMKRDQTYNTSDIARYDVYVKVPLVKATYATPTSTFAFPNGDNFTHAYDASPIRELLTASPLAGSPLAKAKNFINYSDITVNGTTLSREYLDASFMGIEGVPASDTTTNEWLYYYLKIGEFDATDVASASADYTVVHKTPSGTNTTKVRVEYKNSGESDKPIKPLYLKPNRKGDEGVYNIYVVNGVVFIDYAQDIANSGYQALDGSTWKGYAAIPVGFKFYEDAAATVRIPAYGKYAYVKAGDDDTKSSARNNKFFVDITADPTAIPANQTGATRGGGTNGSPYTLRYNEMTTYANGGATSATNGDRPLTLEKRPIKNDEDFIMGVWLPKDIYNTADSSTTNRVVTESDNKTMKVGIYDENYRYRTGDIKVVFRPLARNLITTAVIVERYLTIAVGETVELTIESASATTYSNIKLSEVSSVKSHVYIDGMKITGIAVGTSQIQVSASSRVIDQVTVNVVASKETTAPDVIVNNQWRVLARKLNIRTGPGTNYGKAGTLVMNQVVAGTDTGTGWVEIGASQYVSKQFVVPVTGSATGIGSYTINASSLNVRSGPGSSYAKTGSVTRGTVVEVIAIQNGWAQLASGGWVSTLYLI